MTKASTTIRSWPAAAVACLCAAGTLAILFDDVIRGGQPNIQHLISVVTLIATLYAGHAIWSAVGSKPFAALGAGLIFLAGTGYIVLTSAGRSAHVMAAKAIDAGEANTRYAKATGRADKAEAAYEAAKAEAARECASGDGRKCSGKRITAEVAKMDATDARKEASGLKPAVAASDYLQGAALIAAFTNEDKAAIEAKLLLGTPFLLAVILELGVMVFGHLAVQTVRIEAVEKQALTFERPITTEEAKELKKLVSEDVPVAPRVLTAAMVRDFKAQGLKHSEIAAKFGGGVNQGRISELLNGKREQVVLS